MELRDRIDKFKRDFDSRRRDWLDKWRLLPPAHKAAIVGGLIVLAVGSPVLAWWMFGGRSGEATPQKQSVTLYSSVDDPILRPLIDEFTRATGVEVKVVGDTEATKTTGLVERLLAEKTRPRADVWWSNEPLGTVMLSKQGVFDRFASRAEADVAGGWPSQYRALDGTWYGSALRARVIAYNSHRLLARQAPTTLRELAEARWAGKVGMARPQFGTARTHIAALVVLAGEAATRQWLTAMRDNGLHLYDGNSSVVQAISVGEIEAGLTDTDDVYNAQRNEAPVAISFEKKDPPKSPGKPEIDGLPSFGPIVMPATLARVKGGPDPVAAQRLADFLLSAKAETMLAQSDAHAMPVRPALAREAAKYAIPDPANLDYRLLADAVAVADKLVREILPPG